MYINQGRLVKATVVIASRVRTFRLGYDKNTIVLVNETTLIHKWHNL